MFLYLVYLNSGDCDDFCGGNLMFSTDNRKNIANNERTVTKDVGIINAFGYSIKDMCNFIRYYYEFSCTSIYC